MADEGQSKSTVVGEAGDQSPDRVDTTASRARYIYGELAQQFIESLTTDLAGERSCREEEKKGREAAEHQRAELRERLGRLEVENQFLHRDLEQKRILEYLAGVILSIFGAWAALGGPEHPVVVPAGIIAGIGLFTACAIAEIIRRLRPRNAT